jgi:acyl-CoA reductase-like NAD-dependent aldehyde dehydrogenase
MMSAHDVLNDTFARMQAASRRLPAPDLAIRIYRLKRLEALLLDNRSVLAEAVDADFGHRSRHETELLEFFPALAGLRHAKKHLKSWMRPARRPVSIWFQPGRAELRPQPLGCVGVVVPWNYPLYLTLGPLAAALAAGNRALAKMSEFTPATSRLMAELVERYFADDELRVIEGDASVAEAFVALPFDHLLFTGSTAVGRQVMRSAAANLTPVTLELGGKSPVIVAPGYPLRHAAERIMAGKCVNAGQTCIAPDYALVPAGSEAEFVAACRAAVGAAYPELETTPDYTSIINERHYARLLAYLEDATARGAHVEPLANVPADAGRRRLPPTAVTGMTAEMRVMREEIFGPILPVVPYESLDEAIEFVRQRDRPLALYLFDRDRARVNRVLDQTVSGGVTVNDTLLHIAQEELPFGGVGPSGMGRYHGRAGFETFSQLKPVFRQSRLNGAALSSPPYGARIERLLRLLLG